MKALMFDLKGKNAFFKKPDVNSSIYFSYGHIHKVALLGILGSVLGLGGYQKQFEDQKKKNAASNFPEFYDQLQSLQISIVPQCEKGYFGKKIQYFNNSTGFGNKANGNPVTLQIREMWLDHPHWKIFVLLDDSIEKKQLDTLVDYMLNQKAIYIPYLGKNDHPAVISDAQIVELTKEEEEEAFIHSLFPGEKSVTIVEEEERDYDGHSPYYFKEIMPVGLDEDTNHYKYAEMILTNSTVSVASGQPIYTYNEKGLLFY